MELVLFIVGLLISCVAVVWTAWRKGGTKPGLTTLGCVIATLAFGVIAFYTALVEALCESECSDSAAPEVFLLLSAGCFLGALGIAFFARRD